MDKKMMQVYASIKHEIEAIKKELGLKSESQVLGYLVAIREIHKEKITLVQHQEALRIMNDKINQTTL